MGRPRLFRHVPTLLTPIALIGWSAVLGCGPRSVELATLSVEPRFVHLAYPRFVPVRLRWEPLAELPASATGERPIVFVHLLDREGDVARTFDHELPAGWREGQAFEYSVELFQSAIAPALAAGEYRLTVGLQLDEERRARLRVAGDEVARREYGVASVDVPPADEALPMFRFSNAFQAVEPSGDVQFPARRWFEGEATLQVAEVAGAGTIYVVVQIVGEAAEFGLRLEQGAAEPALWVTSSCSEKQVRLAGTGRHEVLLPLAPSAAGCEVRLAPNFRLEPREPGLAPRTALLEAISWSADPTDLADRADRADRINPGKT